MEPLISVIIPTYSRSKYIKRAINSILAQTFDDYEIIVVDDNQPDSEDRVYISELIKEISNNRIRLICHSHNKGANAARNTGIRESKGKYIAFLDDDDIYMPEKLEIQLRYARIYEKENAGIFIFSGARIDGSSVFHEIPWMKKYTQYIYEPSDKDILTHNYIGSNSFILIDKESLIKVGMYDESLLSCQDWDLYIRLSLLGIKFIGINSHLVIYNQHEDKNRITNNVKSRIQGHNAIINRYESEVLKISEESLLAFYRYEFYQILPFDRCMAKIIFRKMKKYTKSFKSYISLLRDQLLFILVKYPRLYNKIRALKHQR